MNQEISFQNLQISPTRNSRIPPAPPESSVSSTLPSSLHVHCLSCHTSLCELPITFSSNVEISCPSTFCQFCDVPMHECKMTDHLTICRSARRACLNAIHGCPHLVRISEQADHLKVCPANVITCTMSWNRGALAKHDRPLFLAGLDKNNDGNYPGIVNTGDDSGISTHKIKISEISSRRTQHLDVALATRDQENLFKYIHTATEGSIWPICHNPYVHNLDAINVNSITERSMSENTRFTESMQSARISESNGLTNSIDSLQAFENAYSSYMKSSNYSNSEYQDSSAQANSVQDNSAIDNSAFDNSDSVNNSSILQDFSSSKTKIKDDSAPSISSTIHHPVPSNPLFWQRVDFRPKQFVSRGTDPMLEIPLNKQDTRNFVTQTSSDYSLLGPEACLYDVDFCERFFRMIGCDNIQHNFNPRWTRGHRTFEASAQTFPYPAVVLKTDIQCEEDSNNNFYRRIFLKLF